MQTPVDDKLRDDATTFALRWKCEDCAHFDPEARVCGEGFPCDEHRGIDLRTARRVVFCKSFELR